MTIHKVASAMTLAASIAAVSVFLSVVKETAAHGESQAGGLPALEKRVTALESEVATQAAEIDALGSALEEVGFAVETLEKTDGAFSTSSDTFGPIAGTVISFSGSGDASFWVTATEIGVPICTGAQLGVRVDGVDHPLAANNIHTFSSGVAVFKIVQGGVTFVDDMSSGDHTAEVVIRLDDPTCGTATVLADESFPVKFVVLHRPAVD